MRLSGKAVRISDKGPIRRLQEAGVSVRCTDCGIWPGSYVVEVSGRYDYDYEGPFVETFGSA